MKICMAGLGSIGKRHAQNIYKVLSKRNVSFTLDALRVKDKKLDEKVASLISRTYYSYEELPDDYDVIFITNPTIFHYESVSHLLPRTKHMFIEKPVFHKYIETSSLNLQKNCVYYVACPLRHKKIISYIKRLMEQGETFYSIRAISSSYLPDWRKGTDYRKEYSARKELGGGVELDLIHEWDYLAYLFGMPEKMYKFTGHYSNLEINTEDIAVYIAKYPDKTAELHLDYLGAETVRMMELYGRRKKYIADLCNDTLRILSIGKEEVQIDFGADDFYFTEMEYFFDVVQKKKKSFNGIDRANTLIKFVLEGQS